MTNHTEALPPELAALQTAYSALQTLDDAAQVRALRWLFDALDVGTRVRLPAAVVQQLLPE